MDLSKRSGVSNSISKKGKISLIYYSIAFFFFLFLPMTAITITKFYAGKVSSIATWYTFLIAKRQDVSYVLMWVLIPNFDSVAENVSINHHNFLRLGAFVLMLAFILL
jgi:hypothetical protein